MQRRSGEAISLERSSESAKPAILRVARKLAPEWVRRQYTLAVMARQPDRRFMKHAILPHVLRHHEGPVLWIGVRAYTVAATDHLRAHRDIWTLDIDPVAARWGVRDHHLVGDARKLSSLAIGPFSCVIHNGVFGHGIDSEQEVALALRETAKVMDDGGLLVVGWNKGRIPDPRIIGALHEHFHDYAAGPMSPRVTFPGSTHVYDFLEKRPGVPGVAARS